MISSLTIKNIGSYDIGGQNIEDLKKVNFFFGFNGAGKSIIGKYLRNLELDTTSQNPIFNSCSNLGYDKSAHQILTFNDDFVDDNFRKSPDLKGVFSLNASNAQIDQAIINEEASVNNCEARSKLNQKRREALTNTKHAEETALSEHCWNQRNTFSTFLKITLEHSGNKARNLEKVRNLLRQLPPQDLQIDKLKEQYHDLYEKNLEKIIEKIDRGSYLAIRRLEIKLENILKEVILGNEDVDIAALIKTLNSRSWVEQGMQFIQDDSDICPFCQKETIDVQLREQLKSYFDETYKTKLADIVEMKRLYSNYSANFIESITRLKNVFNPDNLVSDLLISLTALFESNLKVIDSKIANSNERKSIVSLVSKKSDLSKILAKVKNNNALFADLEEHRNKLLTNIWNFIAEKCRQEVSENDKRKVKFLRLDSLASTIDKKYADEILKARQTIEDLRSKTVNTAEAVANINTILKNAGFEGFEIAEQVKVNNISKYYLKRLGILNTDPVFFTLSEGEKNFIAFLYFYQLCIGTESLQNNGSKKKIIVIDDPVSSLDSQALFIVSTLIHSLIERKAKAPAPERKLLKSTNISQVFILTHNFYFYKEVSLNKRPICTDHWHYRISKLNNKTSITGDPNRQITDDYSLMWRTIKEIKASNGTDASLNILISNTMRRIIDSYVNFIGYGNDSWGALITENQDDPTYYIKSSFISMINDESHKVSILDSLYYNRIATEQPIRLFDAFSSIFKVIGKDHYEMMMKEEL